jgi:hypothetical protein
MAGESKLDAARRNGDLTAVIGVLREEARTELADAGTPAREQLGLEDATIRVAAGLTGKTDVERRAALREVRPGSTVTSKGVSKTRLSRQEKSARTLAWAKSLSEEQREQFILSERFEGLSDSQQEAISEAFAEITDREYSDSIGIESIDYDSPTPDIDSIVGADDADEADEVDDDDFEAVFEEAAWEAEAT